jgi:hypothetical protein
VLTFNWKDGAKTVSLAELERAEDTGGEDGTTDEACKVLQIADFRCSHLVGNPPPKFVKSEPCRSPIVPVGEGFGFVLWLKF